MLAERRIRVAAVVENVPSVCDFVADAAREAGFDDKAVHHCRLAVDEACTNVVEHAYGMSGNQYTLSVSCGQQDSSFAITIEDEGPPFDPTVLPDPDRTKKMEERRPGGWGIYFIKKLMDTVTYQRRDNRNILTLSKQIPILYPPVSTPAHAFRLTPLNAKVSLIVPQGYLDAALMKGMEGDLLNELSEGRRDLVLDLSEVESLSSGALKIMVRVWQRARDVKGDLVLCACTPLVYDMLHIVGLDMVFTVLDSVDAALNYFKVKR